MDVEKLWNLTKEDSILQTMHLSSSSHSSSSKHVFSRSISTKTATSPSLSSKSLFKRSFSTKTFSSPSPESHFARSFSTKTLSSCSSDPTFRRSFSTKTKTSKSLLDLSSTKCSADLSTKSSLSRSLSQKGASVSRKWCRVAKEHKSRLYIIKRCVLMLVCWHKHS